MNDPSGPKACTDILLTLNRATGNILQNNSHWKTGLKKIGEGLGEEWSAASMYLQEVFGYNVQQDDRSEIFKIIISYVLSPGSLFSELESLFDYIVSICKKEFFYLDSNTSWDLYWTFVHFSFIFYKRTLEKQGEIESMFFGGREPKAFFLLYNLPLYVQPFKMFNALCSFLYSYANVPQDINLLAYDGAMEVGLLLSLIGYTYDQEPEVRSSLFDDPSFSFKNFDCVWNYFILRFTHLSDSEISRSFTYPCRLFSFLLLTCYSLCSINIFELESGAQMFRSALNLLMYMSPNSLKEVLEGYYSQGVLESFLKLSSKPPSRRKGSFMILSLVKMKPDELFGEMEGLPMLHIFGYYIAQQIASLDPGLTLNSSLIGRDDDPFYIISNKFFCICKHYNTLITLVSNTVFQIPLEHPMKLLASSIVKKQSFLYCGKRSFGTFIKDNINTISIMDVSSYLVKVSFSEFNTLDPYSEEFLLKNGYVFWRSSSSDHSLTTQSYLWSSVIRAFLTRVSETIGAYMVYTDYPQFVEGVVDDYNKLLPVPGLDFYFPTAQDGGGMDFLLGMFERNEDGEIVFSDMNDTALLNLYNSRFTENVNPQALVNAIEELLIISFLCNIVFGGEPIPIDTGEFTRLFSLIDATETVRENGRDVEKLVFERLYELKQDMDTQVSFVLARILFCGDPPSKLITPYPLLFNFITCFCTTFQAELRIPYGREPLQTDPIKRRNNYFSSFDWGVVFDIDWGFFFDCVRGNLSETRSLPDEPFSETIHTLNQIFGNEDNLFECYYTKKRSLNSATVYGMHDVYFYIPKDNTEYAGIFPLKLNPLEGEKIHEFYRGLPSDQIKQVNPEAGKITEETEITRAFFYIRKIIELRKSWWSLVAMVLYYKMDTFYTDFLTGFGLHNDAGFEGDEEIFDDIQEYFETSEGIIDMVSKSPLLIAGFKDFYHYLKECYERLHSLDIDPSIKSFYIVSIYFQISLAYNYIQTMVGPGNVFDLIGNNETDTKVSLMQLACCSINFFPSFTSIQTHADNICSIFDVILLGCENFVSPLFPSEAEYFKTQIFLSYLMLAAFDNRPIPHFRALETIQGILLENGNTIPDLLNIDRPVTRLAATPGGRIDLTPFLSFLGYLEFSNTEDPEINRYPWSIGQRIMAGYAVPDYLYLLLMPIEVLEGLPAPEGVYNDEIGTAIRGRLREWITTYLGEVFNTGDQDPWNFFVNKYLQGKEIELKQSN